MKIHDPKKEPIINSPNLLTKIQQIIFNNEYNKIE